MPKCQRCGAQFPPSVRICPNDGTVLDNDATVDARIGTLLDGKYKLEAPLGEGGMGTVYRATHLMLDKPVAVKLIKGDAGRSPDISAEVRLEAVVALSNVGNVTPGDRARIVAAFKSATGDKEKTVAIWANVGLINYEKMDDKYMTGVTKHLEHGDPRPRYA